MQKSNIWPSFTLIINCIHFWFSHPTVRVSRRQFRIWSNMVSHNFYSGTTPDISTQVRTNCFSGLSGDSASPGLWHSPWGSRCPSPRSRCRGRVCPGCRSPTSAAPWGRASRWSWPRGPGSGAPWCGVRCHRVWSQHQSQCQSSLPAHLWETDSVRCSPGWDVTRRPDCNVYCVLVYCAARHLYSTVLHCTVYSALALSPAPPGRLSGSGLRNSHGPRRYLLSCHCHWLKASNFLSVYKYVVSFRIFFQETISFSSKSSAPQVSSENYSFLVLWSNPPASWIS